MDYGIQDALNLYFFLYINTGFILFFVMYTIVYILTDILI
jgi:hypothetical protein